MTSCNSRIRPSVPLGDRTGRYLVLDAGLPNVHAGVLCGEGWLALESRRAPAVESLFECVEKCLDGSGTRLADLAGYLYCEGPGSILGMRIASMAIRSWRRFEPGKVTPCYSYRNLEILAAALLEDGTKPPFALFSDARRGHWNYLEVGEQGCCQPVRRVTADELESSGVPLWQAEEPPASRAAPLPARVLSYELAEAAPWFYRYPLLRESGEPEPWVIREPEYRKWKQP